MLVLLKQFAAQTNLFVLNASIEAARAEHGRYQLLLKKLENWYKSTKNSLTDMRSLMEEIQISANESKQKYGKYS